MPSLLMGCGNNRAKKIQMDGLTEWVQPLVTLDMDPNCGADVVMSLDGLGERSWRHPFGKRLPYDDNTFDELGAFDVLEHVGRMGDWKGFFAEFGEYHRVLKPGGLFYIIVPLGGDALADPGHTRFFHLAQFAFLSQRHYNQIKEEHTNCTDYRHTWKKDFEIAWTGDYTHHLAVVLRKLP